MGYKLRTNKVYSDSIGLDLPDAYAWIDTIIIESRAERANVILKITANKQASIDQKRDLETLSFIIENKTGTDEEGNVTEITDFDDYISVVNTGTGANLKVKAYKYIEDKFPEGRGNFNKTDWESDEVWQNIIYLLFFK